jgi:hypothetical protein
VGEQPVAALAEQWSTSESCLRNRMAQADTDDHTNSSRLTSDDQGPDQGTPWGEVPVLVATVVPRRGPTESAMNTTEDHGGAGRTTALPEQAMGSRSWTRSPASSSSSWWPPGTFSVARVSNPTAPPQTIAAHLADGGNNHMLNLVGAGGGR